jgi:hypothetical protein
MKIAQDIALRRPEKFSLRESLTFFLSLSLSREKLRKNLAFMRIKHSEWGNKSGDECIVLLTGREMAPGILRGCPVHPFPSGLSDRRTMPFGLRRDELRE